MSYSTNKTLHTFIFILPTFTLEPMFAPFLFTPEESDYISEILAQICFLKATKYGSTVKYQTKILPFLWQLNGHQFLLLSQKHIQKKFQHKLFLCCKAKIATNSEMYETQNIKKNIQGNKGANTDDKENLYKKSEKSGSFVKTLCTIYTRIIQFRLKF